MTGLDESGRDVHKSQVFRGKSQVKSLVTMG